MNLFLTRDFRDPTVTLGTLSVNDYRWQTLERPWIASGLSIAGTKGVSCVPAGIYKLVPHNSESHPKVWALVNPVLQVYHWDQDVPKPMLGIARTTVLIHSANYASELRGCIAPGKERKKNGVWGVFRSRDALNELRNAMGSSYDLTLTITESATCLPPSVTT
jgi:hypothetical protein